MRPPSISKVVAVLASLTLADAADAENKTFSPQPGSFIWLDDANWTPPGIPGQDDDVTLGNLRTAELRAATMIHNFLLDTGRLDGEGTLTVLGRFTWADGIMDNSFGGVGTMTVEGGMEIPASAGTRLMRDRTLNLNGGVSTVSGASGFGLGVGFGLTWCISVTARAVFRQDAMGFGDVKFMGAIGAFTGWDGALLTFFLGCVVGALGNLHRLLAPRATVPFGPFLAAGALLVLFVRQPILDFLFETWPEWQRSSPAAPVVMMVAALFSIIALFFLVRRGRGNG